MKASCVQRTPLMAPRGDVAARTAVEVREPPRVVERGEPDRDLAVVRRELVCRQVVFERPCHLLHVAEAVAAVHARSRRPRVVLERKIKDRERLRGVKRTSAPPRDGARGAGPPCLDNPAKGGLAGRRALL
jgi:hypothetical protein